MFNILPILNSDSDNEEEPKKTFRVRRTYDNASEFYQRFRFNPRQAELLITLIGPSLMTHGSSKYCLSPKQKLLVSLRFYASNDFYYTLHDSEGKFFILFKYFKPLLSYTSLQTSISYYKKN